MKELKYEHQKSYDVVIFHFMNTHPPIKHIQSVINFMFNKLYTIV